MTKSKSKQRIVVDKSRRYLKLLSPTSSTFSKKSDTNRMKDTSIKLDNCYMIDTSPIKPRDTRTSFKRNFNNVQSNPMILNHMNTEYFP